MNNLTKRGLLIVIEGFDEKTKSNAINTIQNNLKDRNITYQFIKFEG